MIDLNQHNIEAAVKRQLLTNNAKSASPERARLRHSIHNTVETNLVRRAGSVSPAINKSSDCTTGKTSQPEKAHVERETTIKVSSSLVVRNIFRLGWLSSVNRILSKVGQRRKLSISTASIILTAIARHFLTTVIAIGGEE